MLIDPSGRTTGMSGMLPYFKALPFYDLLFRDLVFSGIALLVVNGITNLTAACLLFAHKRVGDALGGAFGVTLMLWICIQFYMFPLNFMSTAFFVFGACQAAAGYAACIFRRQEEFYVNEADYPEVGKNGTHLVVYFSRMGYVKKQAYEAARSTGAEICEIRSAERTDGTLGFLWCGRYGMHRWRMPIEPVAADLEKYSRVTICSPIWVFALSAPVREFCCQASGKIREADYILVHHTGGRYDNAVREMDSLLGIKHTSVKSIQCRTGKFRETK